MSYSLRLRWPLATALLLGAGALVYFLVAPPWAAKNKATEARPIVEGGTRSAPDAGAHLAGRRVPVRSVPKAGLHGTVVDTSGTPIAGVEVVVLEDRRLERSPSARAGVSRLEVSSDGSLPTMPTPLAAAVTDATGRWCLPWPGDLRRVVLRPRPASPYVGVPRYLWASEVLGRDLVLQVEEGRLVPARVVHDDQGVPAWFWDQGGSSRRPTDAAGRAVLRLPRTTVRLTCEAPGIGRRDDIKVALSHEGELVVHMGVTDGVALTGHVDDTAGHPVPGAALEVAITPEGGGPALLRRSTTAEDGTWRLTQLPHGTLAWVAAEAVGFVYRRKPLAVPLGRDTAPPTVVLRRGCTLAGRVLDSESRGVSKAVVSAANRHDLLTTTAGSDGHFRFEGLEAGSWFVSSARPGWRLPVAGSESESGACAEITLENEGQRRDVVLVLPRGENVVGRVVTSDGDPVEGALVRLHAFGGCTCCGSSVPQPPSTWTNADGAFAFGAVADATACCLRAETGDLVSRELEIPLPRAASEDPVELVARARAVVSGRVVTADGGAPPKAVLDKGLTVGVSASIGGGVLSSGERRALVDAQGCFRLSGLAPEPVTLALGSRRGKVEGTSVRVRPSPGAERGGVRLTLAPTQSVAGLLVDRRGRAVAGLRLRLGPHYRPRGACVTGDDGSFRFEGLPSGVYGVHTEDDLYLGEVRAGDRSARLVHVLRPTRILEGSVLDPEGKPVHRARVRVERIDGAGLGDAPVTHGHFRVEFATEAEVVCLMVDDAEHALGHGLDVTTARLEVEVDRRIDVHLEPGLGIAGRVVDEDGTPVAGVRVEVGWDAGRTCVTDEHGVFRRNGLDPGEVSVDVETEKPWAPGPSLWIEAGRKDLVVPIRRGWTLRGRVIAPDDQPLPGAGVRGSWKGGTEAVRADTDGDGRFELTRLGADEIGLTVSAPRRTWTGHLLPTYRFPLVRGAEDVEIRLEAGAFVEGSVLDPAGRPRAGIYVQAAQRADAGTAGEAVRTRSGEDGTFRLGPLGGDPVKVIATSVEEDLGDSAAVTASAPAEGLRLVLSRRPVIRGRLVGADVEGFHVSVQPRDEEGLVRTAEVVDDGSFLVGRVAPAVPYDVYAWRDEEDRYALARGVTPGGDGVVLALRPGLALEGRVEVDDPLVPLLWPGKSPRIPRVEVEGAGATRRVPVTADGRFAVRGLPPGRYVLRLAHETYDTRGRKVTVSGRLGDVEAGDREILLHARTRR